MSEEELLASMYSDTFAAGAETTANALASGVKLLIENPDVWRRLKADPEAYLRTFVEEVVRLESPTQGLFRTTTANATIESPVVETPFPFDDLVGSWNAELPKGARLEMQARARVSEIFSASVESGMHTLKMDGMEKIMLGLTDLKQVRAVCIR